MKTIKLFVFGLLFIAASQAQVSVNVNLDNPPLWAPADRVVSQYYYLPEIDSYYDVPAKRFLYPINGKWVRVKKLPKKYRNYNLKGGKIVYLTDYRGNAPYKFNKNHKAKYFDNDRNKVIYVQDHKYKKNKNHKKKNGTDKYFDNQDQKKKNGTDKYFENQDQKKKNGTDKYFENQDQKKKNGTDKYFNKN